MKYIINANEFCPDNCPYCKLEYMPLYAETNCKHKWRCENAYKLHEKQEKENCAKIVEGLCVAHLGICGGCPAKPICDIDKDGIKSCAEYLKDWIESIINKEVENERA